MNQVIKPFLTLLFTVLLYSVSGQSINQIKKQLDTTRDPIGYVKYVLKKKYRIDSITIVSTSNFMGLADSIAYVGKVGKTYGPFKKDNVLVKVLAKLPNTFYHVSHILLDTSIYKPSFADSISNLIIEKINSGRSDFATQAKVYSADYASSVKGGDLGWFIKGVLLAQLDRELSRRKKGEIFKVWSPSGLHIVKITDSKKDAGFALMLRVIL